jgi:hypothetical protein
VNSQFRREFSVGCHSASAPLLLRGAAAAAQKVPRVRGRSETGDLPRHSAALHPPGPPQRLGCPPQRPRRPWGATARRARHLRNSHARLNRHRRRPRCGAPRGDLPEPRRWKVAGGGGRSAHVATWEVRGPAAAASAKGAVPRTNPLDPRSYVVSTQKSPTGAACSSGAARRSSYPAGLCGRESLMRRSLPACSEYGRSAGDRQNSAAWGWWE